MVIEAEFFHAGVLLEAYGLRWRQSKTYCADMVLQDTLTGKAEI